MRRYPDFRFPRAQWSAGDACVAGIVFTVGIILIIAILALVASQMPMRF